MRLPRRLINAPRRSYRSHPVPSLRLQFRSIMLAAITGLALIVTSCKRSDGPAESRSPSQAAVVLPKAESPPTPRAYLLHIPGVSGESVVDHNLIRGFELGRLDADIEIYDWTE